MHDAIAPVQNLSNRFITNLRHHATGAREQLQPVYGCNDTVGKHLGVSRRFSGDEVSDCLQIRIRLWSPDYSCHFLSRFFTSSCGMP